MSVSSAIHDSTANQDVCMQDNDNDNENDGTINGSISTTNSTDNIHSSNANTNIRLKLTKEEEHLFDLLEAAAKAYETGSLPPIDPNDENANETWKPGQQIEIRIAGGWVRDKILNDESHDVDVALDCMSGHRFAIIVQTYLQHLYNNNNTHKQNHFKIGVISANPSQSKHLETATMKIHGIELDFVNLRAEEVYESTSRIPTHQTRQFGTPLQDALRRDFTVNALFYNIRTRSVEDWTQSGVRDLLHSKVLVTPLDPHTTFSDDPLRVLRAVRFAVRYDLKLCPTLREAAMSEKVHRSLLVKVSRERVGKELEGMLSGKGAKPIRALRLVVSLKLAGSVFCFPPCEQVRVVGCVGGVDYGAIGMEEEEEDLCERARVRELGWVESAALLNVLPYVLENTRTTIQCQPENVDGKVVAASRQHVSSVDYRMLYLSTFLLPFADLTYVDKKLKTLTIVSYMMKDSIKFKNKDVSSMTTIMANIHSFRALLRQNYTTTTTTTTTDTSQSFCRLQTGLLLRAVKDMWVTSLLLATVAEIHVRQQETKSPTKDGKGNDHDHDHDNDMQDILFASTQLFQTIHSENLDGCWKIRPLLDGKAIIQSLNLPKGPVVGTYLEEEIRWMLLHPDGSKEDCVNYLLQRKIELEEEQSDKTPMIGGGGGGVSDGGGGENACGRRKVSGIHDQQICSKRVHIENTHG